MSVQIPPTVPAGWAPSWNEQYQTWFYINTKSKQSQWELPTSPVVTRPSSPVAEGDKLSPLVASATSEINEMARRFESTGIEGSSRREDADGNGEAPPEVPAGWLAKWNEQYQTWFYYNTVTKESTWETPTGPAAAEGGKAAAAAAVVVVKGGETTSEPTVSRTVQSREDVPVVPEGWTAQWNDMYQTWFYVNTATQETSWEKPVVTVERPVAVSPVPSPAPSSILRPRPEPTPSPGLSVAERTPVQSQGPSGAPEVPVGWVTRFNEQYQTWFYVNTLTGKSSWERPTAPATNHENAPRVSAMHTPSAAPSPAPLRNEPRPSSTTSAPPSDPELPEGWVKRFNDQYQTWFYVNTQTRQSQWEKPTVPGIAVDGATYHESDEELARRLQAEEDGLAREPSPSLPPRPPKDTAALHSVGLQRHASTGGFPDQPPSYEFAVGHGRSASYNGPNQLHPPISPSRPGSAASNNSFQGGYATTPDGSLAPPGQKGKKVKKKRSWMVPAGIAAGGVAGLGVIGAGIYALTGSDIGDRIIDKVTGDDDGGDEVVSSFIGDVVDAVAGGE